MNFVRPTMPRTTEPIWMPARIRHPGMPIATLSRAHQIAASTGSHAVPFGYSLQDGQNDGMVVLPRPSRGWARWGPIRDADLNGKLGPSDGAIRRLSVVPPPSDGGANDAGLWQP